MSQRCILDERKKGGCASCQATCQHAVALHGLSGNGGRVAAANVPKDYRQLTLKNAPAREEQAKIYAHLAKYIATFERQFDTEGERVKSLYLYSVSPGTGKSTTASALVNEWLTAHYLGSLKRGIQPQQVPAYYLDVNELQTRYNLATMTDDKAELDDIKRLMRKCMDVPFLVCDDIGLRSATESFKSIVHAIINARTTESAPTIYTSNVSIGELAGIYDARLQDRISDQCLNLAFSGDRKGEKVMANNNEIKPVANFGDLVTVVGYGNRVFMVEAFTIEELNEPSGITPNIVYDLTCPFTFEFIIGEQADIAVVCKAATAHIFISKMTPYSPDAPVDYPPSLFSQIKKHNLEVITPADVSKHEKPKRKTQRQKQAEIDGLLDELNVLKTVIEICGSDEGYAVRIADVKRKLKEETK